MLELKNIHKFYNHGTINEMCLFENFNLTIDDGQFVSVVGSNGSGKTSMLNLICGSIPLDSGSIIIDGKECREADWTRIFDVGEDGAFYMGDYVCSDKGGLKEIRFDKVYLSEDQKKKRK